MRLAFLALLAAPASAGDVHVVGGPAATQPTIQAAIDAAVDGDIVLVRSASADGFVVDGKALTILGEGPAPVLVSPVEIRNLAAGQACGVRNFTRTANDPFLFDVHDNAGHVRLEELTLTGIFPFNGVPATPLRIANCFDVALSHCDLDGGLAANVGQAGPGIVISNSQLQLDASTVDGGRGFHGFLMGQVTTIGPGGGAAGIQVLDACSLALQGSLVRGGSGGNGVGARCFPGPIPGQPGGTGGPGIASAVPISVTLVEASVLGGAGGAGGAANAGCGAAAGAAGSPGDAVIGAALNLLPGPRRELSVDALTREFSAMSVTVTGVPGETATLLVSTRCQLNVLPTIQGAILVGPSMRRIPLGTIPASGVLTTALPLADLGPGVLGSRRFFQAFCRDAGGQVRMSGCSVGAWLDGAL